MKKLIFFIVLIYIYTNIIAAIMGIAELFNYNSVLLILNAFGLIGIYEYVKENKASISKNDLPNFLYYIGFVLAVFISLYFTD